LAAVKLLVVALSLAVLAAPVVQGTAQGIATPAAAQPIQCAGPPCGYITPIIDLEFSDKPKCSGTPGHIDLSKCIPLPEKGKSVTFTGTLRYYWKESEDLTYPPDPQQDVVVTFSGVSTNPKWLPLKVDPPTLSITAVDLLDPRNLVVDQSNPSSPVVYYEYKAEIKATFTHQGDPDAAAANKVAAKGGLSEVFLKAKSSASGTYFKEGFGVESFRFDARSVAPAPGTIVTTTTDASGAKQTVTLTQPAHAAPAAVLALLGGLGIALLAKRRRIA
jgi:hypothetical protein